jgi:plasmid stabilization system protein ParE
MQIVYEEQFRNQLQEILAFIAKDNPGAARHFRNRLKNRIEQIPEVPLARRKSCYFDDETLRDLVFMGYTAIYRITADEIRMLDLFKWQER